MTFFEVFKLQKKYEVLLKSYGYQDVDIDIHPYFDKTDNSYEICDIQAYFWDDNYGYSLWILSPKHNPSLKLNSELTLSVIFEWDKIFYFLCNSEFLRNISLKEKLADYLKKIGFDEIKISKSSFGIVAFKDGLQYSVFLHRVDVEGRKWEDDEDDEPFSFDDDEIKPYQERFDSFLKNNFVHKYKLNISSDLEYLSVEMAFDNNREYIAIEPYYNLLNVDNDTIENILYLYLSNVQKGKRVFLTALREKYFHIDSISEDGKKIVVYQRGEKFEIRLKTTLKIDFDNMEGHQFEAFCAKVLTLNGYENVRVTSGSGDQGVDIIAYRDGIKYGIQFKRYTADIGNRAVQEVYSGKEFYKCHVGVVLSNQDFTKSAYALADRLGIALWNRKRLLEMVKKCEEALLN